MLPVDKGLDILNLRGISSTSSGKSHLTLHLREICCRATGENRCGGGVDGFHGFGVR